MNEWAKINSDSLRGKHTRTERVKKNYALFNGKSKIMSDVTYAVLVSERRKMLAGGGYRSDLLTIKEV